MPKASPVVEKPSVVINQNVTSPEPTEEREKRQKINFWEYISSLSPSDWKRHVVYLYRTRPIVGQKQSEKYLDKYTSKFTIEDIKNRFGGEEFRVMLLRDDKAILTEDFAVEAAPKFDMAREIPGTDTMQAQLVDKLIGKLTDEKNDRSSTTDDAMGKSIDMISNAFETALQKIAGSGGGNDLIKTIQVLKELGLIGKQENNIVETIRVLKELGLVNNPQQPVNQLETFKSMLGVVKELTTELSSDASPKSWKSHLVDKVVEAAPAVIDRIGGILDKQSSIERERTARANMMIQARTGMPVAPAPAHLPQTQPNIPPQPTGTHPATTTEPMRTVPLDRTAAPADVTTSPSSPSGEPTQEWISRRVVNAIKNGQSGESVVDFLDCINPQICQFFTSLTAAQIKAQFAADAILREATQLSNFDSWVEEVVNYLHEEEVNTRPN